MRLAAEAGEGKNVATTQTLSSKHLPVLLGVFNLPD